MISNQSIDTLLAKYVAQHESDIHIERTLNFVSENTNLFGRDNLKGHITGSAWVLNNTFDKALLIHHKKLGLWFQPGGHVDEIDHTIIETAQREAMEETGLNQIELLRSDLFDLDVHLIPERKGIPAHWHYDFRFVFKSSSELLNPDFAEVNDTKWVPIDHILNNNGFDSIMRMAKKSTLLEN